MSLAADSDFLLHMAASSRQRDAAARAVLSDAQQRSQLLCLDEPAALRLSEAGFDLIAELKKTSPAEGKLDTQLVSAEQQIHAYIKGGAAALSVLTEPDKFSGSLDDLHTVVLAAGTVPVMRKDFLVSSYQVREARLAGASGVLLIAAILQPEQISAMLETAFELGMFVLMEVFDHADLDKCVPLLESFGPATDSHGHCKFLLGVNCRNLRTLQVDFEHFARMAPALPVSVPWVAESGISSVQQVEAVAGLGYRVALVGTALMRSGDPESTVGEFRQAGAQHVRENMRP